MDLGLDFQFTFFYTGTEMSPIELGLSPAEEKELKARATSLGIPLTIYVRNVIRDALKRNPEEHFLHLNRSMRALVYVVAQGLGITQSAEEKDIVELRTHLLETFDKEQK